MERAIKFLQENKEVALATVENDKPKIRVFQIMKMEGTNLYFATGYQKGVYRQLTANPAIEVLAMKGDLSVRMAGKAIFDVDDATCQEIYQQNPVLPRLYADYKKLAYFRLELHKLDYYDLKPTPPLFESYDFSPAALDMGKDETTINTDDRTLTIPIGLRQVIDKMMHTPPTPAEMETAINEVEDAIATIGSATPIMMNISTSDLWVRKAVKLYDENATMPYTLTKQALEEIFSRLGFIISGRPANTDQLPSEPEFAATLLMLREVMNHLKMEAMQVE